MLFSVFDTETTGLPSHFKSDISQQPRIIEFAGIITDGVNIIDRLEFVVNPGIAIEEIITDITGFTNADLADKPDFSEYLYQIQTFFAQADAVVAHNLSFDEDMLEYDLSRRGFDLDFIKFPKIKLCTVEQTFMMYGKRMKLIDLYKLLVGEYVQKHRAMDDVMVLHQVCGKIGLYDAFHGAIEI